MNKTELFIKTNTSNVLMFDDTYLAPSIYGTKLGLEFQTDVSDKFSVGDVITINKNDKTINPWVDGTASIIGITVSSIYPAPGSLVFTSRPLQLPITYTSNESGIIYGDLLSDWNQVDLSDDVAFPITFNIADIKDISSRNTSYSKTISIPGTKNNNEVFKYIFDIQGIDNYDTRIRVKASIVVDTIPVLEGYIQLDTISCDNNEYWTYNCIIFGENGNFSKEIDQNARLEDLDFSEFNHTFSIDAVTQSWSGDYTNGYYYPYIDYNTSDDPNGNSRFSATRGSDIVKLTGIKPAIYAKQYWDKIFKKYGYTYESEFLNSPEFEDLIIPTNKRTIESSASFRTLNTFRAGITQSTLYTTGYGYQIGGLGSPLQPSVITNLTAYQGSVAFGSLFGNNVPANMKWVLRMNETQAPNGDPGGNFFQSPLANSDFFYINTSSPTATKIQTISLTIDYKLTPKFFNGAAYSLALLNGSRLAFYYDIYRDSVFIRRSYIINSGKKTDQVYTTDNTYHGILNNLFGDPTAYDDSIFNRTQVTISETFNNTINPTDQIRIRLGMVFIRALDGTDTTDSLLIQQNKYLNAGMDIEFFPTTNGLDGTYFYNTFDSQIQNNQSIDIQDTIPGNVKQTDFLNSIIKMFNLYLYQDKINPKKIYIEPRDRFYSTDYVDWSNKLDISKDISHRPIVDRKKKVFLSYKDDKDFWNNDYKQKTGQVYSQLEYRTGNEFENGEQKIDVIFSPSPLVMKKINDLTYDNRFIYTQILDPKQPVTSETYNKVDSNIRILYKNKITLDSGVTFGIVYSNGAFNTTLLKFPYYPYAGHLDNPFDPSLDLSFDLPIYLYFLNNSNYVNAGLYNLYYKQFFEEVYSSKSKNITAYVYLTPQDIIDFDYRKLVYLDNASSGAGGYFRVNKIEYDPFNKQSYKVELIKVLNNFKAEYRKVINILDNVDVKGVSNGIITIGNNYNGGGKNVVAGVNNSVRSNTNIVAGVDNQVLVGGSNILTGYKNNTIAENSGIISGGRTTIYGTGRYSNIIGGLSQSLSGPYSSIIGGCNNKIDIYSSNNQILGGCNNRVGYNPTGTSSVTQTTNSLILGGINNKIEVGPTTSATDNVFILGGLNNTIAGGVTNSFILGGENFTATQSNTIYLVGNVLINGVPAGGGSGSTPIPTGEFAIGSGTGITSNSVFKTTGGRSVLLSNNSLTDASSSTGLAFGTDGSTLDGNNNMILSSKSSCVDGGYNSVITSASSCVIIGVGTNYSNIIGSINSCVTGISNTIIGSRNSCANGTGYSSGIISSGSANVDGYYNSVISSFASIGNAPTYNSIILSSRNSSISPNYGSPIRDSSIISGYNNLLGGPAFNMLIIGGSNHYSVCTNKSFIIGGNSNILNRSDNSGIIGGNNNCLDLVYGSVIISSSGSYIFGDNSLILGGVSNTIGATNSMIINGNNTTLITSNATYIGGNILLDSSASGQATISATNSILVNNSYIETTSKILLSGDSNVTLWTSNIVANTSFTINSSSTGTYVVSWLIIN